MDNIETLFKAAKAADITVAVSPHYYYPTDHGWKFEGALEKLMHKIGMFDRKGALNLDGFENSGADWMPQYKQYIDDGKTVVTSPHKVYGNDTNDLSLQLRKRGVDQVLLSGMSANLCTESHMRELLEQGFEVAVIKDATAAAIIPEGDGYLAALTNFRYMANAVWTTEEAVQQIKSSHIMPNCVGQMLCPAHPDCPSLPVPLLNHPGTDIDPVMCIDRGSVEPVFAISANNTLDFCDTVFKFSVRAHHLGKGWNTGRIGPLLLRPDTTANKGFGAVTQNTRHLDQQN